MNCYEYTNLIGSIIIVYSVLADIPHCLLQICESYWLNRHCVFYNSRLSQWSVVNMRI